MRHEFMFYEYDLQHESAEGKPFNICVTVHGDAPDNLEIASVSFHKEGMQPLEMTETQFVSLFPGADDIINNAFEEAASIDIDL